MKRFLILAFCLIALSFSCTKYPDGGAPHTDRKGRDTAPLINRPIPEHTLEAYYGGRITRINLSDYRGKWLVLFFYPADFTFVCPTELKELADNYPEFKKVGAEIASVSTDSVYVHRAWHGQNNLVKAVTYPMLSDRSGRLCRSLGVYDEEAGTALRASFIVSPEGAIMAYEVHHDSIGRNADELLRTVSAAAAVRAGGGGSCPAGWKPGETLIHPE